VKNLRVDVISKLRGCDDFQKLWERRFSVRFSRNRTIEIIGLQDLAQSKKTQRDKDWLMLNRLIENDIFTTRKLSLEKIKWWLYECRSSSKLIELARKNIDLAKECSIKRPLLKVAFKKDIPKLEKLLQNEELLEREKDRKYWELLRKELEMLRHKK